MAERAHAALDAGCDMVLVCNDRAGAITVIDAVADRVAQNLAAATRCYQRLSKPAGMAMQILVNHPRWHSAQAILAEMRAARQALSSS